MNHQHTPISGCLLYTLDRYHDERGFFQEIWNKKRDDKNCCQVNYSLSKQNVLRGIHISYFDKLVACVSGKIFDVVVDFRKSSPSYLQWHPVILEAETPTQVLVPKGCGHAYLAMQDSCVLYIQDGYYAPPQEQSCYAFDPKLDIVWPKTDGIYILSERDWNAPHLAELVHVLPVGENENGCC